jgi:putative DNA primase/helicase
MNHNTEDSDFYQPELNYVPGPEKIDYAEIDVDYITTDSDTAKLFVSAYHRDIKYCKPLGGWHVWTGLRWKLDNPGLSELMWRFGVEMRVGAATRTDKSGSNRLWRHAQYVLSETGITKILKLAGNDPRVLREPGDFDRSRELLNTLSGTINLSTGEVQKHRREDHITRLIDLSYDRAAKAPAWSKFLNRVIPDRSLRDFLQTAIGHSATGDVSEHHFYILYGTGSNGKSTFIEALTSVLGDYAGKTSTDALLAKNTGGTATPDVANLKGKRFVTAEETEEGARLNESLVKSLTGGDSITARYLNQNPFTFLPTHKLWLSTNHRPIIRGTDYGIWRRVKLIPFAEKIDGSEKDQKLPQKLQAERAGILAWIVAGAVRWHREGITVPKIVEDQTAAYRASMDRLSTFIDDRCIIGERYTVGKGELYKAYQEWAEDEGIHAEAKARFGQRLTERVDTSGAVITAQRAGKGRWIWVGIGLTIDAEGDTGDIGDVDSHSVPREADNNSESKTVSPVSPMSPSNEENDELGISGNLGVDSHSVPRGTDNHSELKTAPNLPNLPKTQISNEKVGNTRCKHDAEPVACYVCNKDHPKRKTI